MNRSFSFRLGLASSVHRPVVDLQTLTNVVVHFDVTTTNSDDDKHRDVCSYDTIDALPHIDHYRNLFSLTSPEPKTRPTLEALHENSRLRLGSTIDLNSELINHVIQHHEQQPTQPVEVKPKVEIVKFGWIIGVLVSRTRTFINTMFVFVLC